MGVARGKKFADFDRDNRIDDKRVDVDLFQTDILGGLLHLFSVFTYGLFYGVIAVELDATFTQPVF